MKWSVLRGLSHRRRTWVLPMAGKEQYLRDRHSKRNCLIGNRPKPKKRKPTRGKRSENQSPTLAIKRVTMLSEDFNCFLARRAVALAVLSADESNFTVARNSAGEHACPAFTLEAHFIASAIVLTFIEINLRTIALGFGQGQHTRLHPSWLGSRKHGQMRP